MNMLSVAHSRLDSDTAVMISASPELLSVPWTFTLHRDPPSGTDLFSNRGERENFTFCFSLVYSGMQLSGTLRFLC